MAGPAPPVIIGLSAVIVGMAEGEAMILTVEGGQGAGLPFGSFDPSAHRTFELALRAFVTAQTGFELGYVEQLYTFGDRGRDAPLADLGAGPGLEAARVVSVGYLALTPRAAETHAPDWRRGAAGPETAWSPWSLFFPWEDWRTGRPEVIDAVIAPALRSWIDAGSQALAAARKARAARLFALGDEPWREERVLERYELLYEAGLALEAARDRARLGAVAAAADRVAAHALGRPMISDHRRILATGLGRLRGKLKYRPVAFELTGPEFTLSALQRTVEAVAGVTLHKQNFRRALERTGLVEPLGRYDQETGGRPAELFRFAREKAAVEPAQGLPLPLLR